MLVVPAGVRRYMEILGDEVVLNLDVFSPPRADYLHPGGLGRAAPSEQRHPRRTNEHVSRVRLAPGGPPRA